MAPTSRVLYDAKMYDMAFKSYAMSLIDCKKRDIYYDAHEMIDKILEKQHSDDIYEWIHTRKECSEVLILRAKVYRSKGMIDNAIECLNAVNTTMALCLLGEIYLKTDIIKAKILLNMSAYNQEDWSSPFKPVIIEQGDRNAQYILAHICEDDVIAEKWIKQSAEQKHPLAMYEYAQICKDTEECVLYYKECERLDNVNARRWLIDYYMKIDDKEKMSEYCDKMEYLDIEWCKLLKLYYIEKRFSSDDIQIYRKRLCRVCKPLIQINDPEAMYYITLVSSSMTNGLNCKDLLQRSADLGYLKAQELYGFRYDNVEYCLMATTLDYVPALYNMCNLVQSEVSVFYLRRALDIISDTNISIYNLEDSRGEVNYKYMIRNKLWEIYQLGIPNTEDIPSIIEYYYKHKLGNLLNLILYHAKSYLKKICESVYAIENLKDTPEYCLAFAQGLKRIKNYIETGGSINLQSEGLIKFVDLHFRYIKEQNIKMRDTLNNTQLYIKVLHDTIEKYL
jgi:TPR repeat protein